MGKSTINCQLRRADGTIYLEINKTNIGDEYHYIMICPALKEHIEKPTYLNVYDDQEPSILKYFHVRNSYD